MATILVIERYEAIRKLLASLLRIHGHQARTAASEDMALRWLLRRAEFDCVLLGSPIGTRSGSTLLEEIATAHPSVVPRLIVMTAAVDDQHLLRRAAELRVFAITAKPFDPDDLLNLIALSATNQEPDQRWYAIPPSIVEAVAAGLPEHARSW